MNDNDKQADVCIQKIGTFLPANLAMTAWAFATLRSPHDPLFRVLTLESIRKITEFQSASLSMLAWAFAHLSVNPAIYGSLFQSISHQACTLIRSFGQQVDTYAISLSLSSSTTLIIHFHIT